MYLVGGSEPLLVGEAADAIRRAAREHGFDERQVLQVERGFDWGALQHEGNTLSLFASQRLIELRLPGGKPGRDGAKALQAWVAAPPADTVLLVVAFDAEPRDLNKAKWAQALDKAGAYVPVYPLEIDRLPAWIKQRMHAQGLQPDEGAVALLAERVQGNLLAAQQEIDKLALLVDDKFVDEQTILEAVGDNARFETFGMIDAALAGDAQRALRALRGLKAEGIELVQIMGALLWQLRQLAGFAFKARETGLASALQQARVWPQKRTLMERAMKRHQPGDWDQMLVKSAHIDRQIKGRAAGNPWRETERLLLDMAA